MENLTVRQEILLQQLEESRSLDAADSALRATGALPVRWDPARGVASAVRGRLGQILATDDTATREAQAEDHLNRFLADYGELFGPPHHPAIRRLTRRRTDRLGWTHLEFQQQYIPSQPGNGLLANPLDVYGAKLAAHFAPDGTLTQVQSSWWRDIEVSEEVRLNPDDVRAVLADSAARSPMYAALERQAQQRQDTQFPMLTSPRLVVYPWQRRFRLAWSEYAYGTAGARGDATAGTAGLEQGHAFVDATSGEIFLFVSLSRQADVPTKGGGLGVTPLGGPFSWRDLNIVQVDTSALFLLRDTTHAREIITYNAGNLNDFNVDEKRKDGLANGTLLVSTNSSDNWERLPADDSDSQLTASQQPEVDCHHFVREAYEWYDTLAGGRDGWDDGQYPSFPDPHFPIRAITHTNNGDPTKLNNSEQRLLPHDGGFICWLAFFDGDGETYHYLAGSKFIVGHEYQHAITDFSFENGGNPGLEYKDWFAALHEGLSDVFGSFFAEQWLTATEISPMGKIFRNLVFPRDGRPLGGTSPTLDDKKFDHFADRAPCADYGAGEVTTDAYKLGMILAHCGFLMGAGGVHQRASRQPAFIPVKGLGHEMLNGTKVLTAARIWYRALSEYASSLGVPSGNQCDDEAVFARMRDACVEAAVAIFGADSAEVQTTRLAFHAVGLEPNHYGADVGFIPWGASWRASRSYVSLLCDDYGSPDLFINNGGISEWNPLINVIDTSGQPTQYENGVSCRVRNVGDLDAEGVHVELFYAPLSTAPLSWLPVADKDGVAQSLDIGTLAAGQLSFADIDQDSPPANATVPWFIPPLAADVEVDRFCLMATVASTNDVNTFNNRVQTHVTYVPYTPDASFTVPFLVGNPTLLEIPLDLRLHLALPFGWQVAIDEDITDQTLAPGEERVLHCSIAMLAGDDDVLQAPLDGFLTGEISSELIRGALTGAISTAGHLEGQLAVRFQGDGTIFTGAFEGSSKLDATTFSGLGRGYMQFASGGVDDYLSKATTVCLRPLRAVTIEQFVDDDPIGGITVRVQVAAPVGSSCAIVLPPTDVLVSP